MAVPHKWQFATRFRRHAFGWRSETPILRIKEALAEIKQVARQDRMLAAEGAVTLLEKLSPALEQVDSSSGAIGTAVNKAIESLVIFIAQADVDLKIRQQWLERLWQALQDDHMPYIERLGDYWGELCVTPVLASPWAEEFVPLVEQMWSSPAFDRSFFKGTSACFASLYAAGRHDELLALIDKAPFTWWYHRQWGVKALVALGKKAEAIRYAEASRGLHDAGGPIAKACEAILLSSGMVDEAYRRYAVEANQCTTNLATFRAIKKKYPHVSPEKILRDLIDSSPGAEGKWFAAAKDAGLFGMAIELAHRGPTDPRTLTRAARDFAVTEPKFALDAAIAALHGMACGDGYDIQSIDVLEAHGALMQAATSCGMSSADATEQLSQVLASSHPYSDFVRKALGNRLS